MRTNAHGRRASLRLLIVTLWIATFSATATASAQTTEVVTYYHADAIGSIRMITDANGQVIERHDYLPFGEEWQPPSSLERRLYVGKERDQETGFDYSGARYYAPGSGRFTSPDPLTADALRIISPQRWNRYAYATNNPLTHGDPDGLDVIVFNFVNGAMGAGHLGIMAVDPNTGAALYGGFNPAHPHRPYDRHGAVTLVRFPPGSLSFANGRPTRDSLAQIKVAVGKQEKYEYTQIRSLHFRTSDMETQMLRDFITNTQQQPPSYNVFGYNCQAFCILGLRSAGINAPPPDQLFRAEPNVYFALTLSELAWRLGSAPTPNVETTYCFKGEKGCGP
jgi:RHS repeat-associated protein